MTFLETLQAHKGGLICLKTELYWYKGVRSYDGRPGRVCLLLDTAATSCETIAISLAAARITGADVRTGLGVEAYLLIDGSPQWVWLSDKAIEILVNDQPIN
jgi:hypothetical protein